MSFVHLHVHSQYSMLEATCRLKDIAKKAAENQMPAVALTDLGNMFGAIEFYFAVQGMGINPIVGTELYLAPESRFQRGEDKNLAKKNPNRLIFLAQDMLGYQQLCKLSSIGYKEGFYYKPRIDYEVLAANSSNLICLSGGFFGEVPQAFKNGGPDLALQKIKNLKNIFGDRFYLELNRTGVPLWNELNPFLLQTGEDLGIKVVAANDVHYIKQSEQIAQEVLVCIASNKTLSDESRYRLGTDQFYFKSSDQMKELFKDIPQAIDNTLEIASRCNVKFKLKDEQGKPIYHLPTFPTSGGRTLDEEMAAKAKEGLAARFEEAFNRNEAINDDQKLKYNDRLEFELSVIGRMGFNGYFLIVQDFINWAKENDIPVGPGRGSGAGSLVAYSLRITDLDPMPYNLIFERFLNPERISMPDFDIDFCQDRRQEVIEYVTQKYGSDSVSQIITYGKLQARAALRDVGRVLGMAYAEVDVISKLMPDKLGVTLSEALELEPRIKEQMETNPRVGTMLDLAQKVEGLVRHAGIHAAGVVIGDGKLVDYAPLYRGANGENVVQYDMKHAEKIGLIKFDFLGLKTLTQIKDCFRLIQKNRGRALDTKDISLSDPGIYEVMCKGDTPGIFQFEGDGITDTIKKIGPNCFEDIVAINALYRPGPMDMIPEYTDRKHGKKKVLYSFPQLEPILKETYGVIVYQEQVQLIAASIASYSLGEADMLRRAMGKKIPEEMAAQKIRFLEGAKSNQHDMKKAEELFDLMAKFAEYGFNKSHAAAYCVIAAHTAWLKNYYPVEFYAALLSTEMSDTDKVVKYVKHVRQSGIQVHPPHVNQSDFNFSVNGDDIYFSLGAVKGVGEGPVAAIVAARERLPLKKFENLEQFFTTVDMKKVNKKTLECLIKAGAFDGFGPHRAQLLKSYPLFLERAETDQNDLAVGQASLFSLDEEVLTESKIELEACDPWNRKSQLNFEKEVLGFYLSDHPLRGLESSYKAWTDCSIEDLKKKESKKVAIAGMVGALREVITKKGTRMAFGSFEDLTGNVEIICFPDTYAEAELLLKSEQPLVLQGTLEKDNESCKILVEKVSLLEEAFKKTKRLILHLDESLQFHLPLIEGLLRQSPGSVPVFFDVEIPHVQKRIEMKCQHPQGVEISQEMIENIQARIGRTDFVEMRTT